MGVRYERAPFEPPQTVHPDGHPGNQTSVTDDGTGKATDTLLEIPAVGKNGGTPLPTFLATSATVSGTTTPTTATPTAYPPGTGYTHADCPAGTTFKPLPGGFACQ
jgi:hypothetical protein